MEKLADPTQDYNYIERLGMSGAAGLSDLYQGAKQRLGLATQADTEEKRAIDKKLTDATPGGSTYKFVANAAPLVLASLIPGAGTVAGGALLGAAGGALTPTGEGESAATNTVLGAGLGAAIPGALKAAQAVSARFGGRPAADAVARQVAEAAAPDAAPVAAPTAARSVWDRIIGRGAQDETQQAAQAVADQLRAAGPTEIAGVRVPLSAGATIDNAGLTQLEKGSRNISGPSWQDWQRAHAEAVADALRGATRGADDLASLQATRSANYTRDMGDALSHADLNELAAQRPEFRAMLDASKASDPEAMRSGVRSLYSDALTALDNAGESLTPQHLLSYRTGLNQGFSNAEGRLSAKDAGLTRMKGYYDDFLDQLTGGRVTPVTRAFAEASPAVDAAEAAANVRGGFFSPEGRPLTTVSHGDTPTITETRLRNLIEAQARPDRFGGGSNLTPEANDQLNALLDAIRKQSNVQQLNRAATAGGGSATASNQSAMQNVLDAGKGIVREQFENIMPGGQKIASAWDLLAKGRGAREQEILARALQDPQFMAQILSRYGQASMPSTGLAIADAVRAAGQGAMNH